MRIDLLEGQTSINDNLLNQDINELKQPLSYEIERLKRENGQIMRELERT